MNSVKIACAAFCRLLSTFYETQCISTSTTVGSTYSTYVRISVQILCIFLKIITTYYFSSHFSIELLSV